MLPNITPAEAQKLLQDNKARIVDIREADEIAALHIAGAEAAPLSVISCTVAASGKTIMRKARSQDFTSVLRPYAKMTSSLMAAMSLQPVRTMPSRRAASSIWMMRTSAFSSSRTSSRMARAICLHTSARGRSSRTKLQHSMVTGPVSMDLSRDHIPKEMYTEARTKRGQRAKSPLWFYVKIGKEENPKIAASKIASTLIAIALTPDRSLDIFFNGKLKQLIFVLDCQHLINSFSYKVLDEKYANLTTIKNLIFDLFLHTDIAFQYDINKDNKIDHTFIILNNISYITFTASKEISIYNQEVFFKKLCDEIDENIRQFPNLINKLCLCHAAAYVQQDMDSRIEAQLQ